MAKYRAVNDSITDADVAEAAIAILKAEGSEALSMRKVADALGTYHVAVHRRCGGFEGLLDMTAEHVAASFPLVDDSVGLVEATQRRFEAVYEMWSEHVQLVLAMHGRPWQGYNMHSRFYEPALRAMLEAGMTPIEASEFFSILYRLALGSVIAIKANPWEPDRSIRAVEALGLVNFPSVAKVQAVAERFDPLDKFRAEMRLVVEKIGPSLNVPARRGSHSSTAAVRRPAGKKS